MLNQRDQVMYWMLVLLGTFIVIFPIYLTGWQRDEARWSDKKVAPSASNVRHLTRKTTPLGHTSAAISSEFMTLMLDCPLQHNQSLPMTYACQLFWVASILLSFGKIDIIFNVSHRWGSEPHKPFTPDGLFTCLITGMAPTQWLWSLLYDAGLLCDLPLSVQLYINQAAKVSDQYGVNIANCFTCHCASQFPWLRIPCICEPPSPLASPLKSLQRQGTKSPELLLQFFFSCKYKDSGSHPSISETANIHSHLLKAPGGHPACLNTCFQL